MKSGSSSWYRIYIKGDNNVFDYCDFDGGKYSLKFYHSSGNSVTNCTFNNSIYAVTGSYSDFTLDNCEIQNASTRGIYCSHGTPVVKNSKIHNCTYGIKYYYTSGACKIESNEINDTQYDGLIISHTSPSIKNNYIHDTGGKGISLSASNSRLEQNTINYCNIAIYGSNNSNFSMENDGYNKIIMSSSSSASAIKIGGGTPNIGEAPHDEGENDIKRGAGYSVENLTSSEIMAEKNYWGSSSPSSSWFSGSVSWEPFRSSAPYGAGSTLDKYSLNSSEDQILLSSALEYLRKKELKTAASMLKNYIENYPESRFVGMALAWTMGAYNDMGKLESQRNYLQKMRYHKNDLVSQKAVLWLESLESFSGNKDVAEKIVNSIDINDPIGVEIRLNWADNLINLYDDAKSADIVFDSIMKTDVSNSIKMVINDLKGESSKNSELDKPIFADREQDKIIPDIYSLSNAYPNPFNPSTTIRYELPRQSSVTVVIYNIRGQKVKEYSYSSQNAGAHLLTWNGQNQYGAKAASGLYIIRFKAQALEGEAEVFQKSLKVIMLK